MKKLLYTLVLFLANNMLFAQNVNIPDSEFKRYLVSNFSINTDRNNDISIAEARAFTGHIRVGGKNIINFTGIEEFINLTELSCNALPTLRIISIDISKNTALKKLNCSQSRFANIDVTKNVNLEVLICNRIRASTLDVSKNTKLKKLHCYNNSFSTLDVTKNTLLEELYTHGNPLTTLDVSQNLNLIKIGFGNSSITDMDLSRHNKLTIVNAFQAKLNTLNLANGNNTNMTYVDVKNNANLTCVKIDAGFSPPRGWYKDGNTSFSANCASASINDETFSNALQVYPNPVSNTLTVTANQTEISKLTLYNLLGKKVLETTQNTANLSKLAKGMYILKVQSNDNKIGTKKIIKE